MNYTQFCNNVGGMYGNNTISHAWKLYKRSQHALWMARALRAKAKAGECCAEWAFAHRDYDKKLEKYWDDKMNKWWWVERMCREKAKEFEG